MSAGTNTAADRDRENTQRGTGRPKNTDKRHLQTCEYPYSCTGGSGNKHSNRETERTHRGGQADQQTQSRENFKPESTSTVLQMEAGTNSSRDRENTEKWTGRPCNKPTVDLRVPLQLYRCKREQTQQQTETERTHGRRQADRQIQTRDTHKPESTSTVIQM